MIHPVQYCTARAVMHNMLRMQDTTSIIHYVEECTLTYFWYSLADNKPLPLLGYIRRQPALPIVITSTLIEEMVIHKHIFLVWIDPIRSVWGGTISGRQWKRPKHSSCASALLRVAFYIEPVSTRSWVTRSMIYFCFSA